MTRAKNRVRLRNESKKAAPIPHAQIEGRKWGRLHRRKYREANDTQLQNPVTVAWHARNGAANRKLKAKLVQLVAEGKLDQDGQAAIEEFCQPVVVYGGMNAKVRRDARSDWRREQKAENDDSNLAERPSGSTQDAPTDGATGSD